MGGKIEKAASDGNFHRAKKIKYTKEMQTLEAQCRTKKDLLTTKRNEALKICPEPEKIGNKDEEIVIIKKMKESTTAKVNPSVYFFVYWFSIQREVEENGERWKMEHEELNFKVPQLQKEVKAERKVTKELRKILTKRWGCMSALVNVVTVIL